MSRKRERSVSVVTPTTKAPPHLIVAEDGRCPCHSKFVVRELEDGRLIAFWVGSWASSTRQSYRYKNAAIWAQKRGNLELGFRLHNIGLPFFGLEFEERVPGACPHKQPTCDGKYLGIAFLPKPPLCWLPTAVWPGWRHLCHST